MTARDEDAEHTLLYVDMLGFAALTRNHPKRVVRTVSEPDGFVIDSTAPTQSRLVRFLAVIAGTVHHQRRYGSLQALIFSDCAFLDFGTTARTALVAVEMMRWFIAIRVPVRMGIGKGTFYQMNYAMETDGKTTITESRFMGTAVVNAHAAEQMRRQRHAGIRASKPRRRPHIHPQPGWSPSDSNTVNTGPLGA